MNPSRTLRVLVITYDTHVPPKDVRGIDLESVDWKLEHDLLRALQTLRQDALVVGVGDDLDVIRDAVERFEPHIAINLLDEFAGNSMLDHNVASYLELLGVPYTGCNPRGLLLSRDKALSKKLLVYHSLPVPRFHVFPKGKRGPRPAALEFPLIVKSLTEEASLGISQASVVHDDERLRERVAFIHEKIGSDAIAEQFIEGRELYVGLVGNERVETFPVWELRFGHSLPVKSRIATRRVKWNADYRRQHRITWGRASLDEAKSKAIQELAKKAFRVLGLSGYARMDLRLTPDGTPYFIEANPNPHLGRGEELADSARRAGLSYEALLWRILMLGLQWRPGHIQAA